MKSALVTGSNGLIGSEAVRQLASEGYHVIGLDNDMRRYFFGDDASTFAEGERLKEEWGDAFTSLYLDIRKTEWVEKIVRDYQPSIIIHTAAQPSHDWAAREPLTDFDVNARATLGLLTAARDHVPDAPFIYCSTSKVYGEHPNELPLVQLRDRFELPEDHEFYEGITPAMSVDQTRHSLFGASKLSADLMVQEFGRYFDMPTVCFRPGCLTGPNHAGAELHGFLSYLMKCVVTGTPYTVYGYGGYQVRDNIHAHDLVSAFLCYADDPTPAAVYNLGGGRRSNCSMLEAIALCEAIACTQANVTFSDEARIGDHKWFIGSDREFRRAYPEWDMIYDVATILEQMHHRNADAWLSAD